jgi:hypothetical protein
MRKAGVAEAYIHAQRGILTHGLRTFQRLARSLSHHSDRKSDNADSACVIDRTSKARADTEQLILRGTEIICRPR